MAALKKLSNIVKYGLGEQARGRKRADKKKLRQSQFSDSELWRREDDFARRAYASYDDYLSHQASKLDKVADRLRQNEEDVFQEFKERFESCAELSGARTVLCLAARLGTEVRALHALGYFAVGLDLNPGNDNPYVLKGDFHAIVFPPGSVDAIYCNSIDHVFDLAKMITETRRVLCPGGIFLAELEIGFEEGYTPGNFEAMHWRSADVLVQQIQELGGFDVESVRDLGMTRRGPRKLVVFRKPA